MISGILSRSIESAGVAKTPSLMPAATVVELALCALLEPPARLSLRHLNVGTFGRVEAAYTDEFMR